MAGYITRQELLDASVDAGTLEEFANGSVGQPNINRAGNDVQNLLTIRQLALQLAAGAANMRTYLTFAAMTADTTAPANTVGQVTNDTDASKNGYYVFNGTAWAWSGIQPASVPRVNSLLQVAQSCPWMDPDSFNLSGSGQLDWFLPTQKRVEGAQAIKAARIENGDPAETYVIAIFCNQDATNRDRIAISRLSDGVIVLNTGAVDIARNATGLTRVVLGTVANAASLRAFIDIDYRELTSTGVLNSATQGLYRIARTREADVWRQFIDKGLLPAWLRADFRTAVLAGNEQARIAANAIRGIWLDGFDASKTYRVSVVTKDDPTNGTRVFIHDGVGTVARYISTDPAPAGIQTIHLAPFNNSGVDGYATVNWSLINGPFILSNSTPSSNLVVDPAYPDPQRAAQLVRQSNSSGDVDLTLKPLARAIFVATATDSTGWGSGYLGEQSYVGVLEDFLRTRLATTVHASTLAPASTLIAQMNMYKGGARRISGINAALEFTSYGDEITVNFCKERGNIGAALIDVYIDGTLFDTFSTYNPEPFGSDTKSFAGNSVDVKFDLERAFTYGHVVTVGGVPLVGGMNTQASGATIPEGWDYMVIRRYNATLNAVTHILWFRNAPSGTINVTFNYGESITYMQGTIGNTGAGLDTPLESPFGDGTVSEDPTQPAAVSSGLGFRRSDPRACARYMLGSYAKRAFRLVIRALDPRASGGTAKLDLNFVTNRMHHIMNAGIGGWTADLFLNSNVLLNRIDRVAEENVDVLLMQSCINDDLSQTNPTNVNKAWVTRTGVTAAQLKAEESSNYYNSITGTSPSKTVQDIRLQIAGATAYSLTVDTTNATINAEPGDALIIGSFHGDHRRIAVRLVDTYAAGVFTFKRAIAPSDFAQVTTLSDLIGDWAMVKAAPDWVSRTEECVQRVLDQHPECAVHLATSGAPNFHHRRLFGYREFALAMCNSHDWGFVDFYRATVDFQYTQPQTNRVYIGPGAATTSTGATRYTLLRSTGAAPTDRMLRNPRVMVNGVDRTNKGAHIEGGYAFSWAPGVTDPTLENDSLFVRPYELVFTSNVPPAGATIEIYYATRIWSTDDTHPGRLAPADSGLAVFGNIAHQIIDAQTIGIL